VASIQDDSAATQKVTLEPRLNHDRGGAGQRPPARRRKDGVAKPGFLPCRVSLHRRFATQRCWQL